MNRMNTHLKKIPVIIFCFICFLQPMAQTKTEIKKPTVGLHFFYNDFVTAYKIGSTSLGEVLKNDEWNSLGNMEGGFGIDYFQGLSRRIDLVGTFNSSWVDYLQPTGTLYGSSNYLFDISGGAHFKLLPDNYVISPFLVTKANFSAYKHMKGFSFLPGAGLQICLFKETFVLATAEYRIALGDQLSNQFYYSIGIATEIGKRKVKPPKVVEIPPVEEPKPIEIVIPNLDLIVNVKDEATGQPLQYVDVTITGQEGKQMTGMTNPGGIVVFNSVLPASYTVQGVLNNISTTQHSVNKEAFKADIQGINISLSHNDPRFTLSGVVINKTLNIPEGGADIEIQNITRSGILIKRNRDGDGTFMAQLEQSSDFTVIGKKANYISNIEKVSTKGLNRSATLYVKLELAIEEAKIGQSIVLNNIYFETGKAIIKTAFSSDLEKLVRFLKDNPETKLEIQGHTDSTGSLSFNNRLSQQRAESVVKYLVNNNIENHRLSAKGYGPLKPVADNNTEEGRTKNRRVEMKVTN